VRRPWCAPTTKRADPSSTGASTERGGASNGGGTAAITVVPTTSPDTANVVSAASPDTARKNARETTGRPATVGCVLLKSTEVYLAGSVEGAAVSASAIVVWHYGVVCPTANKTTALEPALEDRRLPPLFGLGSGTSAAVRVCVCGMCVCACVCVCVCMFLLLF
jgi:hypothetical protein